MRSGRGVPAAAEKAGAAALRTPPAPRSEEGLALAPVGGDGPDDPVAVDQVQRVEPLAQLARLGVPEPDPVADLQQVRGAAEQRRVGKECGSRWSAYH